MLVMPMNERMTLNAAHVLVDLQMIGLQFECAAGPLNPARTRFVIKWPVSRIDDSLVAYLHSLPLDRAARRS